MCRGEPCEKETIHIEEPNLSNVEDDLDFNADDQSWVVDEVPDFNADAHALWVMRETFKMLDDGQSIFSDGSEPPPLADNMWAWEEVFVTGSSFEQTWRRSMHQNATKCTTLGDDRGYETA